MGLGLHVSAEILPQGLLKRQPAGGEVLERLERFFRAGSDPLWRRLASAGRQGDSLLVRLHPAAEPVAFSCPQPGQVLCSARTSDAGPGYHHHLVSLLDRCARTVGIQWLWQDPPPGTGDETGYAWHRDYHRLQAEMLAWLQQVARVALDAQGMLAISLPVGYAPPPESFAASPLGFWERRWFERVARASPSDLAALGREFFPWWSPQEDALFWLNVGRVLMWLQCPWRPPASPAEAESYRLIDGCLQRACEADSSLAYPWAAWAELLRLLGEDERARSVESRRPQAPASEPAIGYRRWPMQRPLVGGWTIRLPGSYYDELQEGGRTVVYWWGERVVRASVLTVTGKDGAAADFLPQPQAGEFDEVLTWQGEEGTGWAGLGRAQQGGRPYHLLQSYLAAEGSLCIVSICCERAEDRAWAIETWRSIRRGAKQQAGGPAA